VHGVEHSQYHPVQSEAIPSKQGPQSFYQNPLKLAPAGLLYPSLATELWSLSGLSKGNPADDHEVAVIADDTYLSSMLNDPTAACVFFAGELLYLDATN
jgi:hypothetical protein